MTACADYAGAGAADDDGKEINVVINPERDEDGKLVPVEKTAEQWKEELSDFEYYVLREKGTERAFTGRYHDSKQDGVYVCAGCHVPLYDSKTKFDSGTGWPSYYEAIVPDHVGENEDLSHGMRRVEIVCARCDGHLGHVFPDGPKPTGMRHCVNGTSLRFIEREEFEKLTAKAEGATAGE
ncbi:peptide-methionine (R)-S-oxide reductase MsrB [Algisphaera agarilytica]|uniref:peptide-methionine (R)-S-oxide reductase MsrB n=1 Tax=Algisphaera agarilytica TaxID=1385975 RepID=UPI00161EE508|nr:peptide-methionine (R)-S-oxide reductase MsrB [Algisphaera agarilytica]